MCWVCGCGVFTVWCVYGTTTGSYNMFNTERFLLLAFSPPRFPFKACDAAEKGLLGVQVPEDGGHE